MFSSLIRSRIAALALASLCLAALAGCDSSVGPSGTVEGKVTYNGAPVPAGTTVVFMHQEKSLPASALTDAEGHYSLLMKGTTDVLVGPYAVSVAPAPTGTEVDSNDRAAYEAAMMGKAPPIEAKAPFPAKYQAPATSALSYTVAEGANTYNIDMTD